jgi:hypothetical protein
MGSGAVFWFKYKTMLSTIWYMQNKKIEFAIGSVVHEIDSTSGRGHERRSKERSACVYTSPLVCVYACMVVVVVVVVGAWIATDLLFSFDTPTHLSSPCFASQPRVVPPGPSILSNWLMTPSQNHPHQPTPHPASSSTAGSCLARSAIFIPSMH